VTVDRSDPKVQELADHLIANIRQRAWDVVQTSFLLEDVDLEPYRDAVSVGVEAGIAMALKTMLAAQPDAHTATPTDTERAWTCHKCDARIADVQPETWLAVPCGHYVTHVQMVTMTYGQPSWPVALDMTPRTVKPDTEEGA
jgi:hypothetical protein